MANGGIGHALLLRTGTDDPPQMSRVLGVLYLSGGLLVLLSLLLPHPEAANKMGLYGIVGIGATVGSAGIIWAEHVRAWMIHVVLAAGTGFICLCVYFAGVAAGVYSAMFVWVVLMAAVFFSGRAVAGHVAWILVAWGLTLGLVEETTGFSPITRGALGGLVLIVAAAVIHGVVTGRRSTEQLLRTENEEKARLQLELEHLALHDPLTGIANRRHFERELTRELARASRQEWPLCVVSLDLDAFKAYNDLNGHLAGDRLLKLATMKWTRALRAEDLLARLGGDEFVALLPGCPPSEAERVMQRLGRSLPAGHTCSAGVAHWDGEESPDHLLTRADRAMYEAKSAAQRSFSGRLRAVSDIR